MTSDRKNITQPTDWWAAFESQARAEGLTLSEWAGDCMRKQLPQKVSSGLSLRPAAHRPKKPKHEGR